VITRWNPFNPFWIVPLRAWTYLRLLERAGQRKQLQVQAISNTKSKDPELFLFYDGAVTSLRVMEKCTYAAHPTGRDALHSRGRDL